MLDKRKLYGALLQAIRKREAYYIAAERAQDTHTQKYSRDCWRVQCARVNHIRSLVGERVYFHAETVRRGVRRG